ncbi:hypothetical protein [uncultured Desulfovibrio sp.]|uniref:hypothetical protein n=1 Tax=uncultured Desulfovibrio sp. TaxID=167968 RepID=UPI00262AA9B4|nr:hypothetical protein [uncultured Desulfovibrio sp.]
MQPDDYYLKIVIFFYGRGCWNGQKIGGTSVLCARMSYCAGEGLVQNHKRIERMYQEENLSLRTRA